MKREAEKRDALRPRVSVEQARRMATEEELKNFAILQKAFEKVDVERRNGKGRSPWSADSEPGSPVPRRNELQKELGGHRTETLQLEAEIPGRKDSYMDSSITRIVEDVKKVEVVRAEKDLERGDMKMKVDNGRKGEKGRCCVIL